MLKWLWFLRIFCMANIALALYFIFISDRYWRLYFFINAGLILGYVWYNYIRLFIGDLKDSGMHFFDLSDLPYSVVVPCFNEDPRLLEQCVRSLLDTDKSKKEILIVDDGSTNGIWNTIKRIAKLDKCIKIHRFKENKGKRYAHEWAIKNMKTDFLVSIDSDTVVNYNAIRRLICPFRHQNVGATTGNVLIKNEKYNWLTRIQAGIYWIGLNMYKKGQSTQGNVVCASGCLSAYRREDLILILDDYVNQSWLGHKCHASEDRHLTNLINEMGKDVVYVEDSVCHTEAPVTLKKFILQQKRWKLGFYRECLYMATYSWNKSRLLWFENLVWLMLPAVIILPTMIVNYALLIQNPLRFLPLFLGVTFLVFSREIMFFLSEPKKAFHYLPYIVLYFFVLYPLNIYAIFRSSPEKWMTR